MAEFQARIILCVCVCVSKLLHITFDFGVNLQNGLEGNECRAKSEKTTAIVSLKITVTWNNIVAMGINRVRGRCKFFLPGGLDGTLARREQCVLHHPHPLPRPHPCLWLSILWMAEMKRYVWEPLSWR